MKKKELSELYESYVAPGLDRWKQVARTSDNDFAFLLWATDLALAEIDPTEDQVLSA